MLSVLALSPLRASTGYTICNPWQGREHSCRSTHPCGFMHFPRNIRASASTNPLDALREACMSSGAQLKESADDSADTDETFQDVLEEMEDFWQRDGVPPSEFLEAFGNELTSGVTTDRAQENSTPSKEAGKAAD
eukprot:jgi/Botrbrau1/1683/Bobra.116_2s0027.2